MKYKFLFLLMLISTKLFSQEESKKVKECFTGYKNAILESNGNEALNHVDSKTLGYYDRILHLSLSGDSTTVSELSVIDKMTVLLVRHRIPVDDVSQMSGKTFFVYAVDNGMVGKNSVMNVEIGEVKVDGNLANGQVVAGGQPAPLYFQFNKEDQIWKLDLTSILPPTNVALSNMLKERGMSDVEFIYQSLQALTGEEVSNEIWKPVK